MPRIVIVLLLQAYAVVFALWQNMNGVRSEEAISLLNIPSRDPPLIRTILHRTEFITWGDFFWRIVFATLLIQAVWFIYETAHGLSKKFRLLLCGAWLFSASLILNAGTVTTTQLTALQALLFILLLTMEQDTKTGGLLTRFKRYIKAEKEPSAIMHFLHDVLHGNDERLAFLVGSLWLLSLFTSFSIILFFPIVVLLLLRSDTPHWKKILYFWSPVFLLIAYTLRNPLLAAHALHLLSSQDPSIPLLHHLSFGISMWAIGGGLAVSILGTWGIIALRRRELLASLLLVFAASVFSPTASESILFLPLFIGGAYFLFHQKKYTIHPIIVSAGALVMMVYIVVFFPRLRPNVARDILAHIPMHDSTASILLVGPYTYEWSYYSLLPVIRYSEKLKNPIADYMICVQACPEQLKTGMTRMKGIEEGEVYER